jgi:hypothetical protein
MSLKKHIKRFFWYKRAFEGTGSYLCFFDRLFKKQRLRMVTVRGTRIYVRTNSSDIIAAIRNLYDQEYDHIRISNPKIILMLRQTLGQAPYFLQKNIPMHASSL